MEVFYPTLLAVSAFWLGACPFSVWIGRWLLGKDIRDYGDGNPGAANIFRAGGRKSGGLAIALDIAKGVPFVILARSLFGFPEAIVIAVAMSAILGHAFSPLLHFRGGKSIAVTLGVLAALPQHDMVLSFIAFMFLGFLFLESHAWITMLASVGSLAYLVTTRGSSWESLLMLCVLIVLVVKYLGDLQTIPRHKVRLIDWLHSRGRET